MARAFLFLSLLTSAFSASADELRCALIFSEQTAPQVLKPLPMGKEFIGEETSRYGDTIYFTDPKVRSVLEWTVENGLIINKFTGMAVTTNAKSSKVHDNRMEFIFTTEGRMYGITETLHDLIIWNRPYQIHHSSFLAGKPVGFAGTIRIVRGKVTVINDRSGHYLPPLESFIKSLELLEQRGIDFSNVRVFLTDPKSPQFLSPELYARLKHFMPELADR